MTVVKYHRKMPDFKQKRRYNLYVPATPANELALYEYVRSQGLAYGDSDMKQILESAEQIAILPRTRLVVEDSSEPKNRKSVLVFGIALMGNHFQIELEF